MKFSDISGREAIKARLRESVLQNRISHAQLFLGPEGSGKLAMALAYARYVNCTQRTPLDACGVCPSCLKFDHLAHPDLHFLFPVARTKGFDEKSLSSKLFIKQWREFVIRQKAVFGLLEWYRYIGTENKQGIINARDTVDLHNKLSYKSYESEYKIMIIWQVERLYHAAAPRILKILEEPPDKTLFILIAEHTDTILPTILSRTQLVRFHKLTRNELKAEMMKLEGCTAEEAENISYTADGNLNLAQNLLTSSDYQGNFELFRQWMRAVYRLRINEMLETGKRYQELGRDRQIDFWNYGMQVLHFCLLQNHHGDAFIPLQGEERKFVADFSPFITLENIQEFNRAFNLAIQHTSRNGNTNLIFNDTSLKAHRWLRMKN